MAIIELPPEAIGLTPADIGVEAFADTEVVGQKDTFINNETHKALELANRFLREPFFSFTRLVVPGEDYNKQRAKWDKVIDNVYNFFDVKPPIEEAENPDSRKWEQLGQDGEFGWISSEYRTGTKFSANGDVITFKVNDTIVVRPDGTQERNLNVDSTGMPIYRNASAEAAETEYFAKSS